MRIKLKAITPRGEKFMDPNLFFRYINYGLDEVAELVQKDFLKTTESWGSKHQPKFEVKRTSDRSRFIGPSGRGLKVYSIVNEGSPPHEIIATRANWLAFRFPSIAKTIPGVIGSGPGMTGPNFAFAQEVYHPGSKARKFDEAIGEKWEKKFITEIEKWVDLAVKEAGF